MKKEILVIVIVIIIMIPVSVYLEPVCEICPELSSMSQDEIERIQFNNVIQDNIILLDNNILKITGDILLLFNKIFECEEITEDDKVKIYEAYNLIGEYMKIKSVLHNDIKP